MSSTCPTCGQVVGYGHKTNLIYHKSPFHVGRDEETADEICEAVDMVLDAAENAGVNVVARYNENDPAIIHAKKQAKFEVLEDVIDMLNKEAVDRNCEGVYRWNVPLSVAVDEINLLKQQIESE